MFWLAKITRIPKKNPTENEVGNLFNTKVPKIPSMRWVTPVKIDASINAVEPVDDFRFHTKSIRSKVRGWSTKETHKCEGKDNVLSKTETTKKINKKIKVSPHARWTDPLGSSLHDPNSLDIKSPAATEPYMLGSSACPRGGEADIFPSF